MSLRRWPASRISRPINGNFAGRSFDMGAVEYTDTDVDGTVEAAEALAQLNTADETRNPSPRADNGR